MTVNTFSSGATQSGGGNIGVAASGTNRWRNYEDMALDPAALQASVFGHGTPTTESWMPRAGLEMARQLAGQENANLASTKNFLMGARNERNAAQAGADNMDLKLGRIADGATNQSLDQFAGLRDYLGGAGITGGGLAAGMYGQLELQRVGQMTEGERDLRIAEADRRARQASDNFLQDLGLGSFLNQSPSMLLLDQVNGTIGWQSDETDRNAQIREARASRDQAERESKRNMWGSIFGGALSLGGLL